MQTTLRFIARSIFGDRVDPGAGVSAIVVIAPVPLAAFNWTQVGWGGVSWTLGIGYLVLAVAMLQRFGLRRGEE